MTPRIRAFIRAKLLQDIALVLIPVFLFLAVSCSHTSKPTAPPVPPDTTVTFYTYEIVNKFPHSRDAFTEGLLYDGGFLYEGTGGYGGSSIRKVDLTTGAVLQKRMLPTIYFGEGIVIHQNRIIELTWSSRIGFIYDKATFDSLDLFHYPTEGWGMTTDGTRLIMSDGTSMLRFWNPATLEQVDSIQVKDRGVPVTVLNELEYIRGKIYSNVWKTDRVAIISPRTGRVEGWIDLSGLLTDEDRILPVDVLNGIAYDSGAGRLFVTGKLWPWLFEIKLVPTT